jgi:hypothetical protein
MAATASAGTRKYGAMFEVLMAFILYLSQQQLHSVRYSNRNRHSLPTPGLPRKQPQARLRKEGEPATPVD